MKIRTVLTISLITLLGVSLLLLPTQFAQPHLAAQQSTRTFIVPHFIERWGGVANTPNTFDSLVYLYANGLRSGIDVELYLDDQTRGFQPVTVRTFAGQDRAVCNPCRISLGGESGRNVEVKVEDLFVAAMGLPTVPQPVNLYRGMIVMIARAKGDPAELDRMRVQYWLVNSHTNAFDLSWETTDVQPIPGSWR